jgi:hypothetical protein
MYKLLKLLGVLTVISSSVGQASALSISTSPIFATQTDEEFIFAWTGSSTFNLASLSFAPSSSLSTNLLTTLSPYTTTVGGNLSGSSQLTEILSLTPGTPYTASYSITGSIPNTINVTLVPVSAVPLPASLPLFAMALLFGLGLLGYNRARTNGWFSDVNRQLASADPAI